MTAPAKIPCHLADVHLFLGAEADFEFPTFQLIEENSDFHACRHSKLTYNTFQILCLHPKKLMLFFVI